MAKRKKPLRRSGRPSWIAPLILLAVAVGLGWLLFHPIGQRTAHRGHHHRVAAGLETATPETAPAETTAAVAAAPTAMETETPMPTATPLPSESPTENPAEVIPSASPESSVAPSPLPSASASGNGPELALIIDDCGQWVTTERGFIALPVPLTMSVLPDVRYGSMIAEEAAGAGKGVMLHLPMETVSGLNPGPGKVTTEMSDAQILAQVQDDLRQVPLAQGVNNHEGSKASADERVMRDVMSVIEQHGGLFFIDSKTNSASVAEAVAQSSGVPTAARDVFLDNKADVAYSEAQLREAVDIAKRNGSAIAIGHPRPTTLEAVRDLLPELQAEGVRFVLARTLTH